MFGRHLIALCIVLGFAIPVKRSWGCSSTCSKSSGEWYVARAIGGMGCVKLHPKGWGWNLGVSRQSCWRRIARTGLGISNVYQQQFRESSYSSIQLSSSGLDEILEKLDNPVITVKIILCELWCKWFSLLYHQLFAANDLQWMVMIVLHIYIYSNSSSKWLIMNLDTVHDLESPVKLLLLRCGNSTISTIIHYLSI